jgi:hypothetical protein
MESAAAVSRESRPVLGGFVSITFLLRHSQQAFLRPIMLFTNPEKHPLFKNTPSDIIAYRLTILNLIAENILSRVSMYKFFSQKPSH